MRSRSVDVTVSHELELTLRASVSPGEPEVRYDRNGEGNPGSGPEVEDVRLVLTLEQIDAVRMAHQRVWSRDHPSLAGGATHEQIERFVEAVLVALNPTVFAGHDDRFIEAIEDQTRDDFESAQGAREE